MEEIKQKEARKEAKNLIRSKTTIARQHPNSIIDESSENTLIRARTRTEQRLARLERGE